MRGSGKIETGSEALFRRMLSADGELSDEELLNRAVLWLQDRWYLNEYEAPLLSKAVDLFSEYDVEPKMTPDVVAFVRGDQTYFPRHHHHYLHLRDRDHSGWWTLCGKSYTGFGWSAYAPRGLWRGALNADPYLERGRSRYSCCKSCHRRSKELLIAAAREPYPWSPLRPAELAFLNEKLVESARRLGVSSTEEPSDRVKKALASRMERAIRYLAAERAYEGRWWEQIPWVQLLQVRHVAVPKGEPDKQAFMRAFISGRTDGMRRALVIDRCYPLMADRIRKASKRPDWSARIAYSTVSALLQLSGEAPR